MADLSSRPQLRAYKLERGSSRSVGTTTYQRHRRLFASDWASGAQNLCARPQRTCKPSPSMCLSHIVENLEDRHEEVDTYEAAKTDFRAPRPRPQSEQGWEGCLD